jgi:hypothetical protein
MNGRYTKFGLNRLRGQRVNLEHTDTQTHTHSLLFIRFRMCQQCNGGSTVYVFILRNVCLDN